MLRAGGGRTDAVATGRGRRAPVVVGAGGARVVGEDADGTGPEPGGDALGELLAVGDVGPVAMAEPPLAGAAHEPDGTRGPRRGVGGLDVGDARERLRDELDH